MLSTEIMSAGKIARLGIWVNAKLLLTAHNLNVAAIHLNFPPYLAPPGPFSAIKWDV